MEIDLRPGFCVFAIILAALDRAGSLLPIACAMLLHELGHMAAMLACGADIRRLTLRFADLRIDAAGLGYRQELLCALTGPLVNLACGLLCCRAGVFAACSLVLGIYNLLPVLPLDGGRAIHCALLCRFPPARADALSRAVSFAACGALLAAGIWLCFVRKSGLWPLGTAAYFTIRLIWLQKQENPPCNSPMHVL